MIAKEPVELLPSTGLRAGDSKRQLGPGRSG
jgi:hypothetical protein